MSICLLGVDMENDFCHGGALAVSKGEEVIPVFNLLRDYALAHGWKIIYSKDDHPIDSRHFDVNGGAWPVHCVHGTWGAQFHPELNTSSVDILVKGISPYEDGYSAFEGQMFETAQSLHDYLQQLQVNVLVVGGLTTDYCDLRSVLDACRLGYTVYVVVDACRAVNLSPADGENALQQMSDAGAILVRAADILSGRV